MPVLPYQPPRRRRKAGIKAQTFYNILYFKMPKRMYEAPTSLYNPSFKRQKTKKSRYGKSGVTARPRNNEIKVTDTTGLNQSATTSANVQDQTINLTRGTGNYNNFIGRTIEPISLTVRWEVVGGESSTFIPIGPDTNNMTRITLFQWMDASVPTANDIFERPGSDAPLSPFNVNNLDKLSILSDKVIPTYLIHTATSGSTYASNSTNHVGKIYIKKRKLKEILWTATGADTISNNIYLCFVSDSTATPHPTFTYNTRLAFYD